MRFDLHVHSIYSDDSNSRPSDIIEAAEAKGLDGLAFLDHNSLEGYFDARKLDTDLILVPGMEVSTEEGHVMALGIQDEIKPRSPIPDTIDSIREKGGLAVAAHPSRFWSGMGRENVLDNEWGALEAMNGRSWGMKNRKAQRLAEKLDLPKIGGSDSHRLKTVGKAYTVLEGVDEWEDVISKIKSGETEVGGKSRNFVQTFFYVRRAVGGWIKRGFKRI